MEITFTGTRQGMSNAQLSVIRDCVKKLRDGSPHLMTVHHGGAIGADGEFHTIARQLGCKVIVHPGSGGQKVRYLARAWAGHVEMLQPRPYLTRNREMVRLADMIIAAPSGERETLRSGTWATIRYARKAMLGRTKPLRLIIVYPSGRFDDKVSAGLNTLFNTIKKVYRSLR